MKTKQIIVIISLFLSCFNAIAQSPTNCSYALSLCPSRSATLQTKPEHCYNGNARLFFQFEAANTLSTGTSFTYSVSGGATNSYKVYGPFNDSDNPCDLISSFQAPIIIQNTGNVSTSTTLTFNVVAGKKYYVEIVANACGGTISLTDNSNVSTPIVKCGDLDNINLCEECIPKFLPTNGKYVLSAWVKEDAAPSTTTTYTKPSIVVTAGGTALPAFTPTGQIIDGWQRVEGVFTTTSIQSIQVELKATGGVCYFDDIRIFPFDGSMMSYVYDPITLRLVAELDERNYAKFYEYDEEGKLIRVKKETEKGIMTIQENRENNAVR
jgi:hypothetical protein